METFLQLVGTGSSSAFRVPEVVVRDRPRFPWRGLMLDCSRHFMPLETVKRTLDGMAAVKLNTFHWHLTDDQGFRVESRRYPELHRMGSDGFYYTQAR
jgi:hexosaminidase